MDPPGRPKGEAHRRVGAPATAAANHRARALALCLVACLNLTGCSGQDVFTRLTEAQANEMVALLRGAGVPAEKHEREGGIFALTAPHDSFARAVEVLRAGGLPREDHETLCKVFKKEGMVSSPLEDHSRLMCALSQEIAATLSNIDGVVVARVHLSVPEKDPLAEKAPPSAASVFVKHRSGLDLSHLTGHVKALVVNSIPGLAYDNVTVVLVAARPLSDRAGDMAADASQGLHALLAWGLGLGSAALVVGAGIWGWQQRRPKALPSLGGVIKDGGGR
jgi:type III secretion protein J